MKCSQTNISFIYLLRPPKARPLYFTAIVYFHVRLRQAITFYRCDVLYLTVFYFFYFVSIDDRPPWDLNQTLPEGRKRCRFTNAPQNFVDHNNKNWGGGKKHKLIDRFFRDFRTRHRISPEQNVASTNQNTSVNVQCVPYTVTYFP